MLLKNRDVKLKMDFILPFRKYWEPRFQITTLLFCIKVNSSLFALTGYLLSKSTVLLQFRIYFEQVEIIVLT